MLRKTNNYQSRDAIARPTPTQSTNITQNRNFKNPKKWSFKTTANPMEETIQEIDKQALSVDLTYKIVNNDFFQHL